MVRGTSHTNQLPVPPQTDIGNHDIAKIDPDHGIQLWIALEHFGRCSRQHTVEGYTGEDRIPCEIWIVIVRFVKKAMELRALHLNLVAVEDGLHNSPLFHANHVKISMQSLRIVAA